MVDTKVETISRLAQWKIDNFGPCSYKKSDPFKLGIWNWYQSIHLQIIYYMFNFILCYAFILFFFRHLSIERNRYLYIHLFPEPSRVSKEQPPIARFILRVSNSASSSSSSRKFYISPGTISYWCFITIFIIVRISPCNLLKSKIIGYFCSP